MESDTRSGNWCCLGGDRGAGYGTRLRSAPVKHVVRHFALDQVPNLESDRASDILSSLVPDPGKFLICDLDQV